VKHSHRYPKQSGVIRVDDYCQEFAMQSDGKQGAKSTSEFSLEIHFGLGHIFVWIML